MNLIIVSSQQTFTTDPSGVRYVRWESIHFGVKLRKLKN
ncbi:unnamed protein product [Tenebrio molitor]|nr:unnamed protein product [Tenebrio molitor]